MAFKTVTACVKATSLLSFIVFLTPCLILKGAACRDKDRDKGVPWVGSYRGSSEVRCTEHKWDRPAFHKMNEVLYSSKCTVLHDEFKHLNKIFHVYKTTLSSLDTFRTLSIFKQMSHSVFYFTLHFFSWLFLLPCYEKKLCGMYIICNT